MLTVCSFDKLDILCVSLTSSLYDDLASVSQLDISFFYLSNSLTRFFCSCLNEKYMILKTTIDKNVGEPKRRKKL